MIRFSDLFSQSGVVPDKIEGDASFGTLVMDSRKAVHGCCFVCMPSESTDSHSYLTVAQEAGAVAAIVHSEAGFEQARELGLAVALVSPSLLPGEKGPGDEGWPPRQEQGVVEHQPSPRTSSDPLPWEVRVLTETPEQRIRRTTGGFSEAMWRLAKVAFGDPSSKLKIIGVTGTNGKTTTAWLIRDMLNLLGIPCAYIGTLGFGLPNPPLSANVLCRGEGEGGWGNPDSPIESKIQEELHPLANTTPFSIELNAMLAEAVERGCQAVAMEVSSHALAERRVDGIEFDVAVFTNLTQDHLDYHGTMEAYEAAKWRLFSELPLSANALCRGEGAGGWGKQLIAVLNADDQVQANWVARRFDDEDWVPTICWWSLSDPGWDIYGTEARVEIEQIRITLYGSCDPTRDHGAPITILSPLGGAYNVSNLTCAAAVIDSLGNNLNEMGNVFSGLRPVPGRFEPVPNDSGIAVIVDYAHTPDALEKLLSTVRPLTKGKVITVFGCGGDRDKSKRPLMARAAQEGSDIVVVTSDNPRTEDPMEIIRDCMDGMSGMDGPDPDNPSNPSNASIRIEPSRPDAVNLAILLAEPGDTVVIAGKGHENYQIIGRTKHPMDDRELAREGLRKKFELPFSPPRGEGAGG